MPFNSIWISAYSNKKDGHASGLWTAPKNSSNSPAKMTLVCLWLFMLSASHKKTSSFASSLVFIPANNLLLRNRTTPLSFLETHAPPAIFLLLSKSNPKLHILQANFGGCQLWWDIGWLGFSTYFYSFSNSCAKNHYSVSLLALTVTSNGLKHHHSNSRSLFLFYISQTIQGQTLLSSHLRFLTLEKVEKKNQS